MIWVVPTPSKLWPKSLLLENCLEMNLRIADELDVPELANLFRQTVLTHATQHYTPAQVEAWAASATDLEQFRQFILNATTYVLEDDTGILGFAGIKADGHVASTYVRQDCLHQGVGSMLMQTLLDHAREHHIERLYTEASEFSFGLFKKFGFHWYDTERVMRQGVEFKRYLMDYRVHDSAPN